MKPKTLKKFVDSIRKRKSRRGFVLDIKKISKKQLAVKVLISKKRSDKNLMQIFSSGYLQLAKKPALMALAQKSTMKITSLILIISLNWLGISAIGGTTAYFIDSEVSQGNTFTSGTLDFSLSSPTDNFVLQGGCDALEDSDNAANGNDCDDDADNDEDESGDNNGKKDKQDNQETNNQDDEGDDIGSDNAGFLTRELTVEKEGTMNFQYTPSVKDIAGDEDFCDSLLLTAKLEDDIVYSGNLRNFNFENSPFVIGKNGQDTWNFAITLPDNNSGHNYKNNKDHKNEDSDNDRSCQFNFLFSAWQLDLEQENGFGAEKELYNNIESNTGDNNDMDNEDDISVFGNSITISTQAVLDNTEAEGEESNNNDEPGNLGEEIDETAENSLSEGRNSSLEIDNPVGEPGGESFGNNLGDKLIEKEPDDQNHAESTPVPAP